MSKVDARDSLIRLCERSDDVQVVGERPAAMAAIDAAGKFNPDIMLLNVELFDMSALSCCERWGGTILWASWFRRALITH